MMRQWLGLLYIALLQSTQAYSPPSKRIRVKTKRGTHPLTHLDDAKLPGAEKEIAVSIVADKGVEVPTASPVEAFISPEMKNSLYYTLLLTVSTICQLAADTYITSLVGNKGSEFSVARGIVGTILGFAFFVFGFLTDGFTSRVSRVYGSGKENDPVLGSWIKTAVLAGTGAGMLTLLAFGPTYKLWLSTLVSTSDPSYNLISVWYWTRLLGMTPNLIYNAIMGVLQGMQMPLYIVCNNIFLAVVDVVCNFLFLNVLNLGAMGSPLGINIAFAGSLIYAIIHLLNGPVKNSFSLKPWKQMLPMKENILLMKDGFSLLTRSFLVELSIYLVAMGCQTYGKPNLIAYNTVLSELSKYSYFIPMGLGTAGNMLGGYLLGKKDTVGFKRLATFIPAGGLSMGLGFFAILWLTGPTFWTSFFLNPLDPMYEAILAAVTSLWWIILLIQPINSMLAVYEGLLYASQSFGYVRNTIVIGFFSVFLPLFASGSFGNAGSIKTVILSKTCFDAFRALSYAYKVHFSLSSDIQNQIKDEKESVKL